MMQEKQSGTGFAVKNCCFPVVWLRYFFIAKEKTNQAAVKIAFLASKKSNTGAQGVFFAKKKDAPARGVPGAACRLTPE